ncbi:large conductance mechanosensitive channel protein MscL [Leucobacter sp. W1153]|uniref:large conductance mechanosensitive channel protein MscL n=1 Tax=unclassified Leucobacter TaxID=2621730 RepID=UPI003F387392
MLTGFRDFIMRGNVIELAVAVVIGSAFNAVVATVVEALFTPLIGMFFQADSLDTALMLGLPGGGAIAFGAVIGALLNFVIVAAVVYFVFVLPLNKMRERKEAGLEADVPPSEQELLTEIRDLLRTQSERPGA